MITKRRVVLVVKDERIAKMIRFEAIEFISGEAEIQSVWENNKTPIILEENLNAKVRAYPLLYVQTPYIDAENFIAFCHSNGIECGEYMSKERYDTSKEDCFLCDIGSYGGYKSAKAFNRHTEHNNSMIIYDSKNFIVKIELGSMTLGMLMICPKKHILSAAQIDDSAQVKEYEQIKQDIEWILKGAFGDKPVIFFEHGSAPHGFSSHQRSIVHAHTHVAWGIKFPDEYLTMVRLEPTDIKDLATKKYLSYQCGADGEFLAVCDQNVYVQRQFPRQVIGELVGIPNYKTNWRVEPFEDNMEATFSAICEFLVKNRKFMASRIRKATKPFVDTYPERKK